MKYILIFITIIAVFAMLISSCTIGELNNFISGKNIQEDTAGQNQGSDKNIGNDKYSNKDTGIKDVKSEETESSKSESSDSASVQEVTRNPKNDIMFYSSEVNFAFVYPQSSLILSSYPDWNAEYGDLSLNVSITPLETLEGEASDAATSEKEALGKGDFGQDARFSFEPSRKVVKAGNAFVKEFVVFERNDICDVTFECRAVFYNNDCQVQIALLADKDKIVKGMEEYFTYDEVNCMKEKVWAPDGKDGFYSQLISGQAAAPAMEWYKTFDDIMYLLQINDFKGASAGYSRLIDKRYYEEDMEEKYIIDIAYPQFQSAYAGGLNDSINKIIYDDSISQITGDFKDEVLSYDYEDINLKYFLSVDYQVAAFDENLISLCLDIYPYMGGAHGMLYFETINFDIEKNKLISLEDLFVPGYDYAEAISKYCRSDLIRQINEMGFQPDEEWIEDGTDPDYTDTLTNFLIAPYGLIMKFPAYQVAPYAAGDFSVIIPYSQFEGFINPDSVIGEHSS